jgi:hypothetical protein
MFHLLPPNTNTEGFPSAQPRTTLGVTQRSVPPAGSAEAFPRAQLPRANTEGFPTARPRRTPEPAQRTSPQRQIRKEPPLRNHGLWQRHSREQSRHDSNAEAFPGGQPRRTPEPIQRALPETANTEGFPPAQLWPMAEAFQHANTEGSPAAQRHATAEVQEPPNPLRLYSLRGKPSTASAHLS